MRVKSERVLCQAVFHLSYARTARLPLWVLLGEAHLLFSKAFPGLLIAATGRGDALLVPSEILVPDRRGVPVAEIIQPRF